MMSTSVSMSNALIRIDQICDYLPIAPITNFVDLFEQCAFRCCCSSKSIKDNRYLSYINNKNTLRCVVLLVPILGFIVVGIYDLIQTYVAKQKKIKVQNLQAKMLGLNVNQLPQDISERQKIIDEAATREEQNDEAKMLGLEINQLPQDISERQKIIDNKRKEKLQEATQTCLQSLDKIISEIQKNIEIFKKIINNPQEPVVLSNLFGKTTYTGPHQAKINFFWSNLKIQYGFQEIGNKFLGFGGLDQNKPISQKQQEISGLKKELTQLRQISYRDYLQTIKKEELLQEAQEYYLQSFLTKEQEGIKMSVEQMTLETILLKLKERVAQAKNDYEIVEMQEIILQIEKKTE